MSISINDNFDPNAPKILDNRYSANGVTPYASVAAANLAIPISKRALGLTVLIGTDEYWYQLGITDPDLVIKGGGGGPAFISIARAALQALIVGNALQVGADYAITDFQDKDVSDPNSVVIVKATSTNTISQESFWKRLTQNKAYGAFALDTGVAGSVNQVTVGGVTLLMTAGIPYTTSRINTANLVAANINANTLVSGYNAVVIAGETVIDRPAIIIQSNIAGVNTSSLAVSVTTLTIANLVNLTMGVVQVEQTLDIAYDITADRIINCYDAQWGITMKYTAAQITTLTYNPIVNWRWGHGTFRNWTINGTGYRNFFNFPATTGANTIEQNNNLNGGTFQNVVTRRTSTFHPSFSGNTNNLTFSNVQLLGNAQIDRNTVALVLTNMTASSATNRISGNKGIYINADGSTAAARISLTNTSCTVLTITSNNVLGNILFTAVCLSSLQMTANFVDGTLANSASTYSQGVNVSSNTINGGTLNIPSGVLDFGISVTNNSIQSIVTLSVNITLAGFGFSMANCTFIRTSTFGNYTFSFSSTGTILFNEVFFMKSFNLSGFVTTFTLIESTWDGVSANMGNGAVNPWTVDIQESVIKDCPGLSGSFHFAKTITIYQSELINVTFTGTPNLYIDGSVINHSIIGAAQNSSGTLTIISSNINRGSFIELRDVNRQADVTFNNCQLSNGTFGCYGRPSVTSFFFTTSVFTNTLIDTYDIADTFATFAIQDSILENTTIQNLGVTVSPNTISIGRCKFFNSTFNTQDNSIFSFNDCEISNNTITAPPGGNAFTFDNCIFQYQNTDFSVSPAFINYFINDLTLIKDRGLMKKLVSFDGGAGSGQVGVPCTVIPDMIGQSVVSGFASLGFTAIITKATIACAQTLTSAGGSLNMTSAGGAIYIPATPIATLNSNYLVKNEPVGILNDGPSKYDILTTPTIASITSGTAEFAIEFLIAP